MILNELIIIFKYLIAITMVIVAIVAISTYFHLKMKCNEIGKKLYEIRELIVVKTTAESFCDAVQDYGVYRGKQLFYTDNVSDNSTGLFREEIKMSFTLDDFFKEEI